ncbi:MAG: hypothetical protein HRT61_08275 [Ekhidna sp.]|nr:hypothetical protein [Ekhidna sp.]
MRRSFSVLMSFSLLFACTPKKQDQSIEDSNADESSFSEEKVLVEDKLAQDLEGEKQLIDLKLNNIQDKIDLAVELYDRALAEFDKGITPDTIIVRYESDLKSLFADVNRSFNDFGDYCKDLGVSEEKYLEYLEKIDNSKIAGRSNQLKEKGIRFHLR